MRKISGLFFQDDDPHFHNEEYPSPPSVNLVPSQAGTTEDVLASVDSRPAPAATGTVKDMLESVDSCPALPKPTDDVPSPPAHCVARALAMVVDDVEV